MTRTRRAIGLAVAALLLASAPAAAVVQTKAQLTTYNTTYITTNGRNLITGAIMHALVQNIVDSMCGIAQPSDCALPRQAGNSTTGNILPNSVTPITLKASAGVLYSVQLYGIGALPIYVRLYNNITANCTTDTPFKRLVIPVNPTAANAAGSNVAFPLGVAFTVGLTYCASAGFGDGDSTAPAANSYLVNFDWN